MCAAKALAARGLLHSRISLPLLEWVVMKVAAHHVLFVLLLLAVASNAAFFVAHASEDAKVPFTITLLTSTPAQDIAAGTDNVLMASYQISPGVQTSRTMVQRLPVHFSGATEGMGECELRHNGRKINKGRLQPRAGSQWIALAPVLEVQETVELGLFCSIGVDTIGSTYTWGVAEAGARGLAREGEEAAPTVRIARLPDGRPGVNGVTFTVIPPDITLDVAEFIEVRVAAETAGESTVEGGTAIAVVVRVKNSGGSRWTPEHYALAASKNSDATSWMTAADGHVPLREAVVPGDTATFTVPLQAPKESGRYRLRWHLMVDGVADRIIQQSTSLILTVQATEKKVPPPSTETTETPGLLDRIRVIVGLPPAREGSGAETNDEALPGSIPPAMGEDSTPGTPREQPKPVFKTQSPPAIEYCEEAEGAEQYCDE